MAIDTFSVAAFWVFIWMFLNTVKEACMGEVRVLGEAAATEAGRLALQLEAAVSILQACCDSTRTPLCVVMLCATQNVSVLAKGTPSTELCQPAAAVLFCACNHADTAAACCAH